MTFINNLYLFLSELFHATPTGINFDTYDDIPVEATGENVPGAIKSVSLLKRKLRNFQIT